MTLSRNVNTRERDKYLDVNGKTTVRVSVVGSTGTQTDLAKETGGNLATIKANTDNIPVDPATSTAQTDGSQRTQIDALPTIFWNTVTVPTTPATAIATTQVIHSVTIKALSTNTVAVYVGGSGVTVANGFELLAGESVSLDVTNLATVFCISGSAAQVIRFIAI